MYFKMLRSKKAALCSEKLLKMIGYGQPRPKKPTRSKPKRVGLFLPIMPMLAETDFSSLTLFLAVAAVVGYSCLLTVHVRRLLKETRTAREEKSHEVNRILSAIGAPALLLDLSGKVTQINDDAERFFGSSSLDFKGLTLNIIFPNSNPVLTRKDTTYFHSEIKSRLDELIGVNVRILPLKFSNDYLAVMTIRETEAEMAGEEIVELVSRAAHDFNNLLTSIIGNLTLAAMNQPESYEHAECLIGAKRAALRSQEIMRRLVANVLGEENPPAIANPPNVTAMPGIHTPNPAPSPVAQVKNSTPRVLILDDEEAICDLVATVLGTIGCEVVQAYTAEQAMKSYQDALQTGCRFDLMICDLRLPGKFTGMDVVQQLKPLDPGIKAIVSSGYGNDPIMLEHAAHGFCGAIAKPYEIATLTRTVSEMLVKVRAEQKRTA